MTGAGLYRLFRLAMQLTQQQKIYAAVLGLAVAAFAFDRFVLGPGDQATEGVAAAPRRAPARPAARNGSPAPAGMAQAPKAASPAPTSTLAARLEAVAAAHRLRLDNVGDAFRPSAAWVGTPRRAVATTELVDAVAEFQKKKLMAVMKQGSGGIAIIDKTALSVGQSMDGFRLVAVKDRSAVLRRGTQRVELRLREDETLPGIGSAAPAPTSEKLADTAPGH